MQFHQDFESKALLLVIPTKLELFWQDLYAQKSPAFDYSYIAWLVSLPYACITKKSNFCQKDLTSIRVHTRNYVSHRELEQMEAKVNFQMPAESSELVVWLNIQYYFGAS